MGQQSARGAAHLLYGVSQAVIKERFLLQFAAVRVRVAAQIVQTGLPLLVQGQGFRVLGQLLLKKMLEKSLPAAGKPAGEFPVYLMQANRKPVEVVQLVQTAAFVPDGGVPISGCQRFQVLIRPAFYKAAMLFALCIFILPRGAILRDKRPPARAEFFRHPAAVLPPNQMIQNGRIPDLFLEQGDGLLRFHVIRIDAEAEQLPLDGDHVGDACVFVIAEVKADGVGFALLYGKRAVPYAVCIVSHAEQVLLNQGDGSVDADRNRDQAGLLCLRGRVDDIPHGRLLAGG